MIVDSVTPPTKPQTVARSSRREMFMVVILLAVAMLVRLLLAAQDRVIRWDEPDYLTLGINLLSGRGYTTGVVPELHYTPLFPIVSGLAYLLTRDAEMASNVVYIIAGTLLIVPIYSLARHIYGRWTALVTACLLVVYPALSASVLYWGTMTEPLYILLVYSGFYLTLRAVEDDRLWAYVAAGVSFSLAYLTRPEASVTFVLMVGYLVVVRVVQGRLLTRSTLIRLIALVAAFAVVAAPYLGFLYLKSGHLLISGKLGLTYAMGQAVLNKDPAEYDRLIASLDSTGLEIVWYSPERFNYSVLDDLVSDPLGFAQRILANARILSGQMFAHTIFPTFLGIPVVLGLMDRPWDRQRLRRETFLLTIVAAPLVSFLPFHIEIRFFAPMLPILLMWAGHGLVGIGQWLVDTWHGVAPRLANTTSRQHVDQVLSILPLAVVLAYFCAIIPATVWAGQRSLDWTHKSAGLWLRENTPPDAVIMTRDLSIAVYARRPWIPSPNADYDRVMTYARHHSADYYVVDENEITTLRPQLQALLNEQNPPQGLIYEETFRDGKRRTIIYRIP